MLKYVFICKNMNFRGLPMSKPIDFLTQNVFNKKKKKLKKTRFFRNEIRVARR